MIDKDAIKFLHSPQYETRAEAVDAIRDMRMNAQIPEIIEMGRIDPDLHTLQMICHVLNDMLLTKENDQKVRVSRFVQTPDHTAKKLTKIWEERKPELLAVKSVYWEEITLRDGAVRRIRVDPEAEQPAQAEK